MRTHYGRNSHAGHSIAEPGILIHKVPLPVLFSRMVKFTVFFAENTHKLFNVVVD